MARLAARLVCLLLGVVAGAWCLPAAAQQELARCAAPTPVTEARRIVTQAQQVISDSVVSLPDALPLAWRSEAITLRYEVDVSVCASMVSASMSLYRVGAPFTVSAQGRSLTMLLTRRQFNPLAGADLPDDSQLPVFNGRIPTLLAVPPGTRTVSIDLLTLPYVAIGLARVHIGPTNSLMPLAMADIDKVVGYADAVAGVMLVLAVMCLLLWLQRRHDLGFLWMTLACTAWSVRALAYFDSHVYLSPIWFEQLSPFNVVLTSVCLCAATLAMMAPRSKAGVAPATDWRRAAHQALLFALISSAVLLLLAQALGFGALAVRSYAYLWALLVSLATTWWLYQGRARLAPAYRVALIAAYLGLIASAIHDVWVVTGALSSAAPSYLFWGFTVVLVVYALISGNYIIAMLNRADENRQRLEQRFAAKSDELESSYNQLRKTELASALTSARLQERERLLRDMHDGLGAQLMTALRGVERGALSAQQVAQSLQDGMDELRMLMDSADMGLDLSGALAAWRSRWDSRLGAAGVQLHWHLDDTLDNLALASDVLLQIMRILQEAATNVVKHAGAHNLHVDARLRGNSELSALVIELRDDGRGLDVQEPGLAQRGLRNMQYRARQIEARLSMTNVGAPDHGCRVRLELQIHPALPRHERRRQSRVASATPAQTPALS